MTRSGIAGLALVGAFVLGSLATASASAQLCFRVDEKETGTYNNPSCTEAKAGGEYITATLVQELKPGLYCAKVDEARKGFFRNEGCSEAILEGEYIEVRPLCYLVDGTETGTYEDENCTKEKSKGKYIQIEKLEKEVHFGLWCAKVDKVGTGDYLEATCQKEGAKSEYILVRLPYVEEGETEETPVHPVGPLFLRTSSLLAAGKHVIATATSLGTFTFKPALTNPLILCEHLSAPTLLLGGAPGKSNTEVDFTGCTVDNTAGTTNFPLCDVHNAGGSGNSILVDAADELVYTGTEREAEKEEGKLGDLFTPEGGGTTFVTLEFIVLPGGTGCPSGTPSAEVVTGNLVGEVEPVNAMGAEGMLTFPKTAIKEAWRWKGDGVEPEKLKTGLKLATGAATEIGLADLKLENGKSWGVLTGLGA